MLQFDMMGRQGAAMQGVQLIVAAQPARVTEPSELKAMVRQPVVEVIGPGKAVPEKVPITVAAVVAPSWMVMLSNPDSKSNAVNVSVTQSPGFVAQIVFTKFSLLL